MITAQLLSGRTVAFREPTMADYKEAKKFAEARKYDPDEALALRCLEGLGDGDRLEPLELHKAKDYVEAVEPLMSIKENQNYLTLFFAKFMMTDEETEQVKTTTGDEGEVRLLSGRTVVFREPTMADLKESRKFAQQKRYDVDEALAFRCLEAFENSEGDMVAMSETGDPDYVRAGAKIFSLKEHQNYRTAFFARHMLSKEEVESIKEQAKNI